MTRRLIGLLVTFALGFLSMPLAAVVPERGKVPRVGVLCPMTCTGPSLETFRQALHELGYVEGQTIALEYQAAEGREERLPALAVDLVRRHVDVIFTVWGTAAALAAKHATASVPIIMGAVGDPVEAGLVASLARPAGNITGLSSLALDLEGKRLELLKEVVPGLAHVAVLWDPANPYSALAFKQTQAAAQALGVQLVPVRVREPDDFERVFAALSTERPDALVVHAYLILVTHRARIVEFAAKSRLPAIYSLRDFIEAGGLMAYGVHLPTLYRRAATYVDKILKGAKPADLPVEQPMHFELVINLKTAQALGLTIPPTLLFQADEVIR